MCWSTINFKDKDLMLLQDQFVAGSDRRRQVLVVMNTVNASSTAVFTQAVEAINRAHDGNHQQALRWLSDFKHAPDAWGTLIELISQSNNSDVLFHAANIANSKANNEWHEINDDVRRSLVQVVRCGSETCRV
jgi:hypothetical protein